jgi:hypothetical protein
MNGWGAFRTGLSLALRYRRLLLILFAVNLLSGLCLVALPALSLAGGLGRRPAIYQAADGLDPWMIVETLVSSIASQALAGAGTAPSPPHDLASVIPPMLLAAALLPLLAWLSASFLNGGLLLTCAEAPQPFQGRRFLWGCWHWFGAFLLLGAAQGVAFIIIFGLGIAVAVIASALVGRWLAWVVVPTLVLLGVLWLVLLETTCIAAVADRTRNIARAFGRAAQFLVRHLPSIAGLYGLALLLVVVLHGLYQLGLRPHLRLDWWPFVLLAQQAFILARLWARLVRLAGGMALYTHVESLRRLL